MSATDSIILLQGGTRNCIRTVKDIHRPLSYSERLKDCTKPAVSYQIITTLVEIVSQEIYEIQKKLFELLSEILKRVFGLLLGNTDHRIRPFRGYYKQKNAFHYTRVQQLRPEDYPLRKTFCENFLRRVDRDPRFPSRIIFSDESLFTQEGIFNSHNMHLWSDENPRLTRNRNFQIR